MRTCSAIALFVLLASCQVTQAPTAKEDAKGGAEPVKQYALHGQVLRLDTQGKIAAIKHEAIGDWMGPMTMEFPVKDQPEFETLRLGEKINATVFVKGGINYWVSEIHEDTGGPAPASK